MTTYNTPISRLSPISRPWSKNSDLWILVYANILMGVFIYLVPFTPLRIILGILFTFFIPGYAMLQALFPTHSSLRLVQHITGSFGLSLVVNGLTNLPLAYLGWMTSETTIIVTMSTIWFFIAIAVYRRTTVDLSVGREDCEQSPTPTHAIISSIQHYWRHYSKRIWLLHACSLILLLFSAGHLIWATSTIHPQFTEFYIVDQTGSLDQYPSRHEFRSVGNMKIEEVNVVVGFVNHENQTMTYSLFYRINDGENQLLHEVNLNPEEIWESDIPIQLSPSTKERKITFELYRNHDNYLYDSLYVWLDPTNKQ